MTPAVQLHILLKTEECTSLASECIIWCI